MLNPDPVGISSKTVPAVHKTLKSISKGRSRHPYFGVLAEPTIVNYRKKYAFRGQALVIRGPHLTVGTVAMCSWKFGKMAIVQPTLTKAVVTVVPALEARAAVAAAVNLAE